MEVLRKRGFKQFLRIDSGGQARVYKSERDGELVAIKVIHVEGTDQPLNIELKRELQVMRTINHPNCIRVKELFRTRNKFYIIMEFMPNGTISALVKKFGPICEWNARCWFNGIAHAVRYLHEHKIAHRQVAFNRISNCFRFTLTNFQPTTETWFRDLKLENVLLDAYLNPVVADFGFSLFVTTDEKGDVIKSQTFCGTPSYSPPEIIKRIPYNPYRADIWCLGVMLFIMINKIYPFDRHDKEKMFENQIKRNYHLEKHIEERCSGEVKDMIQKLLEPYPRRRPTILEVCKHPWIPVVMHQNEYSKKQKNWQTITTNESLPRESVDTSGSLPP